MTSEDTIDYQTEQETCVLCGKNSADNGGFTLLNHRGNTIRLCCSGCVETFRQDPDFHLARLRKAFEAGELKKACDESPPRPGT